MGWTRTLIGVAASLVGFAASPATSDESPAEAQRDRTARPRLEAEGWAASGPSFYVWEEDARQGRRWAAELSRHPDFPFQSSGSGEPSGSDQPAT